MTGPLRFAARTGFGPRGVCVEDAAAVFTRGGSTARIGAGGSDAIAGATGEDAVLAVLDGMDSQRAGALACARACEFLAAELAAPWPTEREACAAWLVAAVRRLAAHQAASPTWGALSGALALVVDEDVHVVHVGEVRGFVVREGRLVLRTRADTMDQALHAEQGLPLAQLVHLRQVLTQVIGFAEPTPHHAAVRLAPGDVLLLASDGLHEAIAEAELAAALDGEPAAVCAALLERASRDSADNVTLLVARRDPAGGSPSSG